VTPPDGGTAITGASEPSARRRGPRLLLRSAARALGIVLGTFVLYRILLAVGRGELTVQLAGRSAADAVTIRHPLAILLLALAFTPVAVLPIAFGVRPRLLHHPYATRVMIASIALIVVAAVTLQLWT
jgi:hypothetical protein